MALRGGGVLGMPVSPLMDGGFSPSPAQLGMPHDAVQAFSSETSVNSTEPPLERLKRKVQILLKTLFLV